MIRIEIERRLDCKQGKGRMRVNPCFVIHEPDEASALAEIKALRLAGDEIAPGYMPMIQARLYDAATFQAWVQTATPLQMPAPFRTLSAAEIAAL